MIIVFYRDVSNNKIKCYSELDDNLTSDEVQAWIWEYNDSHKEEKAFAINTRDNDYVEYLFKVIDKLEERNENILEQTLEHLENMSDWVKGW